MDRGWEDYLHWQSIDPSTAAKINALIKDSWRDPFRGIGKPEPLKSDFAGYWARRITGEHRFVYQMRGKGADRVLAIIQCRYHYK
jgi:toxin YoeB